MHKFKTLGLVLVAIFAMSAMVASAAQAAGEFTWTNATSTLDMTGENTHRFTVAAGTIECNEVSGSAAVTEGTTAGTEVTTESLTFQDSRGGGADRCWEPALGVGVITGMNACDLTFTAGTQLTSTETTGTYDIGCPAGHVIEVKVGSVCTIEVKAQTPTGGHIIYKTIGAGATTEVTAEVTLSGIHYVQTGSFCPGNGFRSETTFTNGTYAGNLTSKGTNTSSSQAPISVSGSGFPGKKLEGSAPTGYVGETLTVTWENPEESSATINDETSSDETVAKTVGSACGTISAEGSCTSRKVECLKAGEATLTARDTTTGAAGEFKVKCDTTLTGEAPTAIIGETVTVTWKNDSEKSIAIEDESNSNGEVAKTVGTGCETIAATSSCTSRKVECLKEGETTITARDTPSIEGKVTIKCDRPPVLTGEAPTGTVGETITVTWKNTGGVSAVVNSETSSDETIAKTVGSACGTIAAGGSCTKRKVECLKKGEATITAQVTSTSIKGEFKVKCDDVLEGSPTTGKVGETVTVTWTNNSMGAVTIEDESTSDGTVAETLGSSCGEIAATSNCTKRKIKCLKAGESTITVVDTPSVEGKFLIKCS